MKTIKTLLLVPLALYASQTTLAQTQYNGQVTPLPGGFANTAVGPVGVLNAITTGNLNTAIGLGSMIATNTGSWNSAIGVNSLNNNTSGSFNAALGSTALYLNTTGINNTGGGFQALRNNTTGNHNSAFGFESLLNNVTGDFNSAVGIHSLFLNNSGTLNSALGDHALYNNTTGNKNTAVGASADVSTGNLTNATAIGFNAIVTGSDQMILGNTSVNVGVGLSGIIPGPQNRLEIKYAATTSDLTPNFCGGTGFSGLRFRDLTSASTPCTNPGAGVLGLDANGDVIYVPGGGAAVLANNGLQVSSGFVQLGGNCLNLAEVNNATLLTDRRLPLNNKNLIFFDAQGLNGRVGIGFFPATAANPCPTAGNLLELNLGTPGSMSGLRLTDLAGSTPQVPNGQVLSVDANGDVILTTASAGPGGGPGDYCANSPTGLTADYEMPLNNAEYNFTAPVTSNTSRVNIGYPACSPLTNARLNVADDNIGTGIYSASSTTTTNSIGVYGAGIDNTGLFNTGNMGVLGETGTMWSNNHGAGVAGFVGPANISAMPFGSVGVYGNATTNGGLFAGFFDGNVWINGTGWITSGTWLPSDKRFKKDIQHLENVTEKLMQLNGYSYNYRRDEFKNKNFDGETHLGLLAQEVKEIFPELVRESHDGYYGVNYEGMVPVLLEGLKEQQKQIEELKALVHSLAGHTQTLNTPASNVSLSDKDAVVLNQNVPNPFAESTVITYNIPGSFSKAQMLFSTSDGKIIRVVDIVTQGQGRLNIFANDLSTGIYTYTLVVDGKTIDTKRMIKE